MFGLVQSRSNSKAGTRRNLNSGFVIKIKDISAFAVNLRTKSGQPRSNKGVMARPVSRYPRFRERQTSWKQGWKNSVLCLATAEDGAWGLGITSQSGPVVEIINRHLGNHLVGENAFATEKIWDMMVRMAAPYGATGPTSFAISAIDNALWDLKGKILKRPVYELLGGPQKEKIFCYATGRDLEWYLELGFKAVKVFLPYGPEAGLEGLEKNEAYIAESRQIVGDQVELMLDCWMSLDEDYAVGLAERLKPYRLRWIEEALPPADLDAWQSLRQRLPWQTLASGEHWHLPAAFAHAVKHRLVDILQPDVLWVGGITAAQKICHLAEAAGISVIPHGAMNAPYGQHLAFAMPAVTWGERSGGVSRPGVPLENAVWLPGTAVIKDGYLIPSDAPGFGIEVTREWIEDLCRPRE